MTCDGAAVDAPASTSRPAARQRLPARRLELIKGPPAVRRAHLDQLVAALWPLRASRRAASTRAVLAQRNALLAADPRRGGAAAAPTSTRGIASSRQPRLALRAQPRAGAGPARRAVRRARRAARLRGARHARVPPAQRGRATSTSCWRSSRARLHDDLERGFTSHGPHRDELASCATGASCAPIGSQGEQRLALLALLLAERDVLARERGRTPLMLLDDVMSELDPERRELLADELASGGQSVIATTDLAHVPGAEGPRVTRLRVIPAGEVRRRGARRSAAARAPRPTRRRRTRRALARRALAPATTLARVQAAWTPAAARDRRRRAPRRRSATACLTVTLRRLRVGAGARADGRPS